MYASLGAKDDIGSIMLCQLAMSKDDCTNNHACKAQNKMGIIMPRIEDFREIRKACLNLRRTPLQREPLGAHRVLGCFSH